MLCFSCDSPLRTISSRVLRLEECLDQLTEQEAIGINSPKRILRLPHETGSWCTWKDGSFRSRNALTVTRLPIQSHTLHSHHTVAFWLISPLKGLCGAGRGGGGGGRGREGGLEPISCNELIEADIHTDALWAAMFRFYWRIVQCQAVGPDSVRNKTADCGDCGGDSVMEGRLADWDTKNHR